MLTVLVPATQKDLTTLDRVAAMLALRSADETVLNLITQASRAIATYCRRPFGIETLREEFAGPDRSGCVLLGRDPVVEFEEVRDGEEIIPTTGYRYDATTGLFAFADEGGRHLSWRTGVLSVTYRAGYVLPSSDAGAEDSTLPEEIERAAIRLVAAYLSIGKRDPLIKNSVVDGIGSTSWYVPGAGGGLPDPEAEQLLRPHRRLF